MKRMYLRETSLLISQYCQENKHRSCCNLVLECTFVSWQDFLSSLVDNGSFWKLKFLSSPVTNLANVKH